ncbi:MAG: hypothetical protein IPM24_19110 [Bryobacterales bacterium]|nr:hypothetical protein [Bryobacterales bacterium]
MDSAYRRKGGDKLGFVHVATPWPTINLSDRMQAIRGGRVEAVWPVMATEV